MRKPFRLKGAPDNPSRSRGRQGFRRPAKEKNYDLEEITSQRAQLTQHHANPPPAPTVDGTEGTVGIRGGKRLGKPQHRFVAAWQPRPGHGYFAPNFPPPPPNPSAPGGGGGGLAIEPRPGPNTRTTRPPLSCARRSGKRSSRSSGAGVSGAQGPPLAGLRQ